jgi:hypothetical protein
MINEALCEVVILGVSSGAELTTSYGSAFEHSTAYSVDTTSVTAFYNQQAAEELRSAFYSVLDDDHLFLDSWLLKQASVCVEASKRSLACNWLAHVNHNDYAAFFDSAELLKYLGHDNVLVFPWIKHVVQWKRGNDDDAAIAPTLVITNLFLAAASDTTNTTKVEAAILAMLSVVSSLEGRRSVVAMLHPAFRYACLVAVAKLEFNVAACFKWATASVLLLMTCQHGFEEAQPTASSMEIRDAAAYSKAIVGNLYKTNTVAKSIMKLFAPAMKAFIALKSTIQKACGDASNGKTAPRDASAFCAVSAAWWTLRLTMVEYEAVELLAFMPSDEVVSDDASWFETQQLLSTHYDQLYQNCNDKWQSGMNSDRAKGTSDGCPKVCPTSMCFVRWDLARVHCFYSNVLWDRNGLSNVGLCVDTVGKACLDYDSSGATADSIKAMKLVKNLIRRSRVEVLRSFLKESTEMKVMAGQVCDESSAEVVPSRLKDQQWVMRKFKEALQSPGELLKLDGVVEADSGHSGGQLEAASSSESPQAACSWPKRDTESVWKHDKPKMGTWIMSPSVVPKLISVLAEKVGTHRTKQTKGKLPPLAVMSMGAMLFLAAQSRLQHGGCELEKIVLGVESVLELLEATGGQRVAWVVQDLVMRGHNDPLNSEVQSDYLRKSAYYLRRLHNRHGQQIIAAKDEAVAKGKPAPWALGTDLKRVEEKAKKAVAKEAKKQNATKKMVLFNATALGSTGKVYTCTMSR